MVDVGFFVLLLLQCVRFVWFCLCCVFGACVLLPEYLHLLHGFHPGAGDDGNIGPVGTPRL